MTAGSLRSQKRVWDPQELRKPLEEQRILLTEPSEPSPQSLLTYYLTGCLLTTLRGRSCFMFKQSFICITYAIHSTNMY